MSLKQYSKIIAKLAKKYPNAVVFYRNPEHDLEHQHHFSLVDSNARVGLYADDTFFYNEEEVNAVCIN